ncbi:ABC transporter ATP-binding protein [Geoglobus acetivorans]|uniref:Branched-chain amino acid transport ATP-binding protein LivG n=1 Tax=Geoglobus acetivorans TaxID=565033 RepID=A0A0A7GFL5_GEOAI|nr:Branched-chain amino acid transport ATP-binding protein LivG [Geoglobus acetivorans]
MILQTYNLSKFFEGLKALDSVSISVPRESLTLIIGPNGSGKTTFINTVTGFYRADGGRVEFAGKDITNFPPHRIFKEGMVRTFQIPRPFKKLTVIENMLMPLENPGESLRGAILKNWVDFENDAVEKAYDILEFLNIDHLTFERAETLSGGQLRLLEIGKALMTDARLIVMDEPLAGVAPALAHEILKKIKELCDAGKTFLIVEHRLDIILDYADKVYVMGNGRLIAEGGREVIEKPEVVEVYLGA